MRHTIKYVGGPIGKLFRRRGWAGITLPVPFWGAYVLMWWDDANAPDVSAQKVELRHEVAHADQIARMGALRWTVTILWQYIRHGYQNAPLEVEARKLAEADEPKMIEARAVLCSECKTHTCWHMEFSERMRTYRS